MTDRDLAGCAQVLRYYHSADGISTMDPDDDGPWVAWTDYADLLAKYEALLSRAPSRDAERLDWMAHHSVSIRQDYREEWFLLGAYHMKNPVVDDRKRFGSAREAIDAAIAAAERENHG